MSFIYRIVSYLNDLSDFFYDLMLEVWDWPYPFWLIGYIFYDICLIFNRLAWRFSDFAEWLEWADDLIEEILSWSNIKSLIRSWLPGIEALISWFSDWWYWVEKKVNDWWKVVQVTVKGWIDAATEGIEELVEAWNRFWKVTWPEWVGLFNNLKAAWDNFWVNIFPTLLTFTWLTKWWNDRLKEIDILIDSSIRVWFPFYDDLVKLWSEIRAFFVDPLQWCYNKLDDFFERFW